MSNHEEPSKTMISFLDQLARLGGEDVRTTTFTVTGLSQEQLRYRHEQLSEDGGNHITVRTVGERPGKTERL